MLGEGSPATVVTMVLLGAGGWPRQGYPAALSADLLQPEIREDFLGKDSFLCNAHWL